MKKLPIFKCQPIGSGIWRFWCPYCARYHDHGAEPGHRVAHCTTESPLKDGGYELLLDERFAGAKS
jgi:hypothetical protein